MACFGNTVGEILEVAGIQVSPPRDLLNPNDGEILLGNPELDTLAGISRNQRYVRELTREVGKLISLRGAASLKGVRSYYNPRSGQYQPYPTFNDIGTLEVKDQFLRVAEALGVLAFNKVVTNASELNVPLIDRFTGDYCLPQDEEIEVAISRELGIPATGLFTVSQRFNNVNNFGFTFTGVDLDASAAFGSIITEVKGLQTVSWSSHRDKNSDRRTYEQKPTGHSRGSQTIAGSMVFTLFNEDPIRAMTPIEFFHGNTPIVGPEGLSNFDEMDPTDVPRFDLAIILQNEYGAQASMVIYGIDITDNGGSISMRQLENEVVIQYKALGIDPLKPVDTGTDREINIFGVGTKGAALFERRRRNLLLGDLAGGGNFEDVYTSTMDRVMEEFRPRDFQNYPS